MFELGFIRYGFSPLYGPACALPLSSMQTMVQP